MASLIKYALLIAVLISAFLFSLRLGPGSKTLLRKESKRILTQEKKPAPVNPIRVEVARVQWPSDDAKQKITGKLQAEKKEVPQETDTNSAVKPKVERDKSGEGGETATGDSTVNIVAEFDCPVEFYLSEMRRRGAKTVLYERHKGRFYELLTEGIGPRLVKVSKHFSPVTRRLTDDYPGVARLLKDAEQKLGPGRYEVVLLIPRTLEVTVNNIVERVVRINGHTTPDNVGTVFVSYRKVDGALSMFIKSFILGGKSVPVMKGFRV